MQWADHLQTASPYEWCRKKNRFSAITKGQIFLHYIKYQSVSIGKSHIAYTWWYLHCMSSDAIISQQSAFTSQPDTTLLLQYAMSLQHGAVILQSMHRYCSRVLYDLAAECNDIASWMQWYRSRMERYRRRIWRCRSAINKCKWR